MATPRKLKLKAFFNDKDFVKDVYEEKYILVIGSEVILNKEIEEFQTCQCDGDIIKYIVSKLNTTDVHYERLSQFIADTKTDKENVSELIENINYDLNIVSPELLAFLKTKLFKCIITTNIDHYLDAIMDEVWGPNNWNTCNIFKQDSLFDIQNQIEAHDIKPTLFYLFGQSSKNNRESKFVATENDAIKLIANNWIGCKEQGKTDISVLKQYISSKRLLALGCKFDDWYFRFFWYSLKGGLQGQNPPGQLADGEVAISWRDNESDNNLKRYLDNTNHVSILPDARSFMKEMTTKLNPCEKDGPLKDYIFKTRHKKGIFLSYHGPDFFEVYNIFQTLRKKNYMVWIDDAELSSGDHYHTDIPEAIAKCKIFIPVISDRILNELKNMDENSKEPYYLKEWRWAQQNQKIIMPIGINDAGKEGFEMFNNCIFGNKEEHEDEYLTGTDLSSVGAWQALIKQIEKEYSKEQ